MIIVRPAIKVLIIALAVMMKESLTKMEDAFAMLGFFKLMIGSDLVRVIL
jgi:hypothetical protein